MLSHTIFQEVAILLFNVQFTYNLLVLQSKVNTIYTQVQTGGKYQVDQFWSLQLLCVHTKVYQAPTSTKVKAYHQEKSLALSLFIIL